MLAIYECVYRNRRASRFCRVIDVNGRKQICFRDKEVFNLYNMFYTRNQLHQQAYQHKTAKIIEIMIGEALQKADPYLYFAGTDGVKCKMSEAINDMVAYTRLTDHIYYQILNSDSTPEADDLKPAREILLNVERRRLYRCVGQAKPKRGHIIERSASSKEAMRNEIAKSYDFESPMKNGAASQITPNDLILEIVNMDYGMKDENPIDYVYFFEKTKPDQAIQMRKNQVSHMLPDIFHEQQVRVYCKRFDEHSLASATQCFKLWCEQRTDLSPPKVDNDNKTQGGDIMHVDLTPINRDKCQSRLQAPIPINWAALDANDSPTSSQESGGAQESSQSSSTSNQNANNNNASSSMSSVQRGEFLSSSLPGGARDFARANTIPRVGHDPLQEPKGALKRSMSEMDDDVTPQKRNRSVSMFSSDFLF